MQTSAPSFTRIFTIAGFTLSCFGLLMFLWLSFGGATPLKPKGYRFEASFPEAIALAEQADVRSAGVSIGKVVKKNPDPQGNRTLATIELESKYAPLRTDARAILRQKTLLGETYVELTTGSKTAPTIPENGMLARTAVAPTVEFDEVLKIFDKDTRTAFQVWQREQGKAFKGRGKDFNTTLGALPQFTEDARSLLDVLDERRGALRGLIRDTGSTFEGITRDEGQLRNLITKTQEVFATTASQREALADTFQVFPTFLDESKLTLARLKTFSQDTNPLLVDLRPALQDLQPTLVDVRRLAPDLERLFADLDPLIKAGSTGFPALGRVLKGLSPVFEDTSMFLSQLNPLLQYIESDQPNLTDFISAGASALGNKLAPEGGSNGHVLPQLIVTGSQTMTTLKRTPDNRGNAYQTTNDVTDPRNDQTQASLPSFDCRNVGGPKPATDTPACILSPPVPFQGRNQKYPQVRAQPYPPSSP